MQLWRKLTALLTGYPESKSVFSSYADNKFKKWRKKMNKKSKRKKNTKNHTKQQKARNYSNKRLCVLKELIIMTFYCGLFNWCKPTQMDWGDSTLEEAVLRLLEARSIRTTLRGNVSIQPSTTRALEHEQTLNQTKRRTNWAFHSAPMPVLLIDS